MNLTMMKIMIQNQKKSESKPKPQPKPQQAPPPQSHPHEHHYATLGLTSNATPAEVRRAYRNLAMQYHPDRNKEADPLIMKNINHAYETIMGKGIKKRKNLKK